MYAVILEPYPTKRNKHKKIRRSQGEIQIVVVLRLYGDDRPREGDFFVPSERREHFVFHEIGPFILSTDIRKKG